MHVRLRRLLAGMRSADALTWMRAAGWSILLDNVLSVPLFVGTLVRYGETLLVLAGLAAVLLGLLTWLGAALIWRPTRRVLRWAMVIAVINLIVYALPSGQPLLLADPLLLVATILRWASTAFTILAFIKRSSLPTTVTRAFPGLLTADTELPLTDWLPSPGAAPAAPRVRPRYEGPMPRPSDRKRTGADPDLVVDGSAGNPDNLGQD